MWMSQRKQRQKIGASTGMITISGGNPGVMMSSEKRDAEVCAPGGYIWKPVCGENVLVINSDNGVAVAGRLLEDSDIQPGEVMICSQGGASILLKNDGDIYLTGKLHPLGGIEADGNEAG